MMDSDGYHRNVDLEEKNPKRRMKTPFQLEALERLYAEDRYPTEAVRAELSLHLNLSDKQLQMWFCHRRLKDRKDVADDLPSCLKKQKTQAGSHSEVLSSPDFDFGIKVKDSLNLGYVHRKDQEINHDLWPFQSCHGKQELQMMETRRDDASVRHWNPAIVSGSTPIGVVSGAQTCDHGPDLGIVFDALPSGAFGSAIGLQLFERDQLSLHAVATGIAAEYKDPETCSSKMGEVGFPLTLARVTSCEGHGEQNIADEQHFVVDLLPEQAVGKGESSRGKALVNRCTNPNGSNETEKSCSTLDAFLLSEGRKSTRQLYDSSTNKKESIARRFFPSIERQHASNKTNGHRADDDLKVSVGGHRVQENVLVFGQDSQMTSCSHPSVEYSRLGVFEGPVPSGTTCEVDDVKTSHGAEAVAELTGRDFERHYILKRKKEVQKLRELERQDRDKRKEEERAARKRQKEEERIQREQGKETERQEKRALKEGKRMERQQHKEEVRRAKEAAKLKAASERAAAKRVSRELMDTIEDDKLELLEIDGSEVAWCKYKMEDRCNTGLVDVSNELLKSFPPSAVKMSKPLTFCVRGGLEHAFGLLFMVWRFLTTFADVIGLWPFTLDEFEEALHDFDSRLLGEIHIFLIKMIVKNIEDAAHATANGSLSTQNGIGLLAGGHLQILEAAAEWGFSLSEWGEHVNPTTWPDILRQLALAAGHGPKWKRVHHSPANAAYVGQVRGDMENSVASLRSGVAAANALASILGKRVGLSRKYRLRLTPGTVKYAAFHVLSLEGEKGLSISEVAEKIQRSGLRDLKTSKTPEASIAAALSRDANLFERVAASKYCVRSAFRKDADDGEDVLQSAKNRIQLFQNGILDVDDTENVADEAEDIEKESDYDSDGRDVEVGAASSDKRDVDMGDELQTEDACFLGLMNDTIEMAAVCEGDAWVQGLMEGEYSDLSVEERLMALVALITIVNEGNTLRSALEARTEAAGTLKRQLWAENQLEKRRQKEDQISRLPSFSPPTGVGHENCFPTTTMAKIIPREIATDDHPKDSRAITQSSENDVGGCGETPVGSILPDGQEMQTAFYSCASSVQGENSRLNGKARLGTWVEELYAIRSVPLGMDRRRNRYWQFLCGDGRDPGYGRIYFESIADGHWEVIDSEEALDTFMSSLDVRGTREAGLHGAMLQVEAVLRQRMERAAIIQPSVDEIASSKICSEFQDIEAPGWLRMSTNAALVLEEQSAKSVLEDDGTDVKGLLRKQILFEDVKSFGHWIWIGSSQKLFESKYQKSRKMAILLPICVKCHNMYERIDGQCQDCHPTPSKCSAKRSIASCRKKMWMNTPPRLHPLKSHLMAIEDAIPSAALKIDWQQQHRKSWASFVKNAVTVTELFQALLTLEKNVEQGWLAACVPEISSSDVECLLSLTDDLVHAPWIPRTSAALGLRVVAFNAALLTR